MFILPEGDWVNFFNGKITDGERWLKDFEVPLDEMPVWVKRNADIPFYPEKVNCTDEMDFKKVKTLKIDNSFKGIFKANDIVLK